jgi:predicted negative regulator of RcsB-dependent stress response
LEAALEMSDEARDREGRKIFGQDTSVIATSYLAHTMWLTGHVAIARELVTRQLAMAEASQHLPTQVNAIDHAAILAVAEGDHAAARPLAVRMGELSEGPGLTLYSSSAALILAWCDGRDFGAAGVLERMRKAIADYIAPGSEILHPLYTGLLAEFEADGPDPDQALTTIGEALVFSRASGENWTDPVLHRICGDILLKRGDRVEAEQAYLDAIDVARAQHAPCFGLQAALRLAMLRGSSRAREELAAALQAFPAGAEWKVIEDARALLEALSRTA